VDDHKVRIGCFRVCFMLNNISPLTVVHDFTDSVFHFRGWFLVQLSMDVRGGLLVHAVAGPGM
jgi:hypothetical protein